MPHFTDILLVCIALGMPAYFVCRASRFGVGLGAVSFWLLVYLCGAVSCALNGTPLQDNRASGVEEWLMGGWLFGIIYCCLVWLLKETFLMCRRGVHLYQQQVKSGLSAGQCWPEIWHELNRTPQSEAVEAPSAL